MNDARIILKNEVNRTPKGNYCMFSLTCRFKDIFLYFCIDNMVSGGRKQS